MPQATPPVVEHVNATAVQNATPAAQAAVSAAKQVVVVSGYTTGHIVAALLAGLLVGLLIAVIVAMRTRVSHGKSLVAPLSQRAGLYALLLDRSTKTLRLVPLRNVGGNLYYYELGGKRRFFIAVNNDVYYIDGKPVLLGRQYGMVALEANPDLLAAFGIAKLALPEDVQSEFDREYNPEKGVVSLLTKLSKMNTKLTGRLKSIDGLAVEIAPPKLIESTLNYIADIAEASLKAQQNSWQSIESTAKQIEPQGAKYEGIGKSLMYIAFGAGILFIMLMIGRMLSGLAG